MPIFKELPYAQKFFQKLKRTHESNSIANASFYAPPTGKSIGSRPLSDMLNYIQQRHKAGSFVITDLSSFSTSHLESYLATPHKERQAKYATNNWRRMHGYPLRRGLSKNAKQCLTVSEEKFAWERFAAMERAGYTLSIVHLDSKDTP